jgi:Predicted nucleic acid-binding protein, contains PIN domain
MEAYLKKFVVAPYNRALYLKWAQASNSARRNGKPIQCADAWIAATALLYGIPLITHNLSDFTGVDGLTIISKS